MRRESEVSGIDCDAVRRILASAPVRVGIVYGSVARGDDTERSDVDLAVAFDDGLSSSERTRERLALIEALSVQLGTDDIDLTPLDGSPPELLESIRRDGVVVYGSPEHADELLQTGQTDTDAGASLDDLDEIISDIERVV